MYLELISKVFAGLGLFFVGIKLLSANMQQLASPRLRKLIVRATAQPLIASLLGAAGGMLMQKPSGVISILTSMQASGLITLRQAMPIIAWCNVGLALLAFFVVIPISVFIGYVIGITGFLMMFCTQKKYTVIISAVFGAALLFFGLDVMKDATAHLRQFDWFRTVILYANYSSWVALFIGAFVAAVSQSFIAIAIMAISLVETGALGAPEAMMIIYGANFGVGFFRRLMTASMTGAVQQMFLYQNFFRYIGTGGSVLLFYLARIDGTPVVLYLARSITDHVGAQLAWVFLACNLPAVLVSGFFQEPLARFLERRSPASVQDELTRLKHLARIKTEDPEEMLGALDAELAERTRHFSLYIEALRPDGKPAVAPEVLHTSTALVMKELAAFENDMAKSSLPADNLQRLSNILSRRMLIQMLDDALFQMTVTLSGRQIQSPQNPLRSSATMLIEAMETFVLILAEAMETDDPIDIETLSRLTQDKGPVMDAFRQQYLERSENAGDPKVSTLLDISNQYERIVWIVNRIAQLLAKPQQ